MAIRARGRLLPVFALIFFLSIFSAAEGTRTWVQSSFDELSKGTAKGVAIRSQGGLELAPSFKAVVTTPSTYIWDIATDADSLYAAAGSPARVYRITSDGVATPIFEPQELQVQALVVDKNGVIYAATNPDGKVYRIERRLPVVTTEKPAPATSKAASTSAWSSSVYFEPGTKYIWALALDGAGNLYVATGDKGEVFKVTPSRAHSVFFKSEEAHIRALAVDLKGNLIAGSDGSGLVYRITPAGEGFVLYSAPKKEITALTVDKSGNIYAAGSGEKRTGASSGSSSMPTSSSIIVQTVTATPATQPQPGSSTPLNPSNPTASPISRFTASAGNTAGGSDIYRIASDGSPTRSWTSREDLVYALAFAPQGDLLAGTGNDGNIFSIAGEDRFTDLLEASANQVTAFARAPNGGLYVATSNLGKIFLLGATPEGEGSYESDVFDAQVFSRWGRAEFRGSGNVDLFARSGNVDNPDRHWSPWIKVDLLKEAQVPVPPARFVQWKAVLHAGDSKPRLDSVGINYLPKNVAPDFDEVTVQPGVRYQSLPKPAGADLISIPGPATNKPQPKFEAVPPATRDSNSIGVKWTVHDDNDDQMVYSVYYRGDGEHRWLLLKDDLSDKFYSFDAALLPDGGYTIKVVASDVLSHSPGEALSAERESDRFEVDTTPPRIEGLAALSAPGNIHVTFRASDSFSPIKRAEYSADAGDWHFISPIGELSDSTSESYDFQIPLPEDKDAASAVKGRSSFGGEAEHVVVVRVYDRYDNMSTAKTVIRGK